MQEKTIDGDSRLGNVNKNNFLLWVTRFVDGFAIVKLNICFFLVSTIRMCYFVIRSNVHGCLSIQSNLCGPV